MKTNTISFIMQKTDSIACSKRRCWWAVTNMRERVLDDYDIIFCILKK